MLPPRKSFCITRACITPPRRHRTGAHAREKPGCSLEEEIQSAPGLTIPQIVVPGQTAAYTSNGVSLCAKWLLSWVLDRGCTEPRRTPSRRSSQNAPWPNVRLCEGALLDHHPWSARHGIQERAFCQLRGFVTTMPSRESTPLLRRKSTTLGPSSGRPASMR